MASKRQAGSDSDDLELDTIRQDKKPKKEHADEKHTLDSDEEDSRDKEIYNVLNPDDIEGAEDGVARMEGDIRVTPFNMDEELQQGHFDEEGHYHWNRKDEDEVKDNWLDDLEFGPNRKAKQATDTNEKPSTSFAGRFDSVKSTDLFDRKDIKIKIPDKPSELEKLDTKEIYCKIVNLMKPKESVKKVFQRLSGHDKKLTTIQRFRLRKEGKLNNPDEIMNKLTEYVNEILMRTSNIGIYDETYEEIKEKIRDGKTNDNPYDFDNEEDDEDEILNQSAPAPSMSPTTTDMFGDEFDLSKLPPASTAYKSPTTNMFGEDFDSDVNTEDAKKPKTDENESSI